MTRAFLYFSLIAMLFGAFFSSIAQDSHYNTYQFGTRSTLMGGAVMGYAKDNTSIFYNPGSLAFVDSNTIKITANVYQIESYRIGSAGNVQKDLTSNQVNSQPLLVSGMLNLGKNSFKLGYGVISPVNFNFKSTSRINGFFSVVDDTESPGQEEFVGQSSIGAELTEVAGILSLGYKINPNWSVGLSNFGVGRTQDFSRSTLAQFYLNDASRSQGGYSFLRNVNYFHLRYEAKLGIAYRKKSISGGFAVTFPSVAVFSSGTVTGDVVGTNTLFNNTRRSFLASDRQEDLRVRYQTPLALSLGVNWVYKKSTVGFACNYHFKQSPYTVIDPKPSTFVVPSELYTDLGSQDFLKVRDAARSVFNIALGYEYAISPSISLLGSFRTNQSYYDRTLDDWKGIRTQITTWDIYHISFGGILKQGHSQISVGVAYGSGFDPSRTQTGEFSVPDESSFLNSKITKSKASYNSLGFLLGYSFQLFDLL